MTLKEHGDLTPLRPASLSNPIPDPLGRNIHSLPGFPSVVDEAARAAMTATLITQANSFDNARVLEQTAGLQPGLYVWSASAAQFWFLGAASLNISTVATGAGSWIRIVDVGIQGAGTVTSQVYDDPGSDTIIQSAVVSSTAITLTIEASFPNVLVGATPAQLPRVGDIYRGVVNATVAGPGPTGVQVRVVNPDGIQGGADTVLVTTDAPPALLTLGFAAQGGGAGGPATYPGAQTQLKAGDVVWVAGTADKAIDAIVVSDVEAGTSEVVAVPTGTSFSIGIAVADRGTAPQALAATVAPRDAVTGAVGAPRSTDELGGSTDGVDVVTLSNLYPTVVVGAVTYPGAQGALKASETASVVNTLANYDTIVYDSPTSELTPTAPTTGEDPKVVTRIGGTYNIATANFRVAATRAANDATTTDTGVVAIAAVAATLAVTEPAARLRSGGLHGTAPQDHPITITASQQLLAAPTLAVDGGGSRGALQAAFAGGPTVWAADLRVDETVPDEKGVFNWGAIAGVNLAGIVTSAITGDATYELGGFVQRVFNFAAFQAVSTEAVVVSDEAKMQSASFSNGNPGVPQPFGTADTTTVGQEGWFAPTAATGSASVRMLHSPSVDANSGGITLTDLEETV